MLACSHFQANAHPEIEKERQKGRQGEKNKSHLYTEREKRAAEKERETRGQADKELRFVWGVAQRRRSTPGVYTGWEVKKKQRKATVWVGGPGVT